ncbi:glutathione S-transferase [Variovorax sp. PAMC 28711]|uniref:glutathione S-transferase n=1 Tax=Variovorax sp. PAMC 28711 TaxID=1795631 RepID=UPI00078B9AED|nr:glutathione S-transferase [Variovorax sp. PAMC 28711]AMM23416.1 glutathione S-transferase [Variovorax sp. PAMC 28711]
MRARLALIASGERCELREVVLRDKPAALLATSPKGTVPVLVTPDGAVIEHSLDVMLWALRRNDPWGWLAPESASLDDLLALVTGCDGDFKTQLDRYKYPDRFVLVEGEPTPRDRGAAFLAMLDARLAASTHLAGERPSLADAALMPFVRQFSMVEPHWFAAQHWPHLQAWLVGWTGTAAFATAMHKYAAWAPGCPLVEFPAL